MKHPLFISILVIMIFISSSLNITSSNQRNKTNDTNNEKLEWMNPIPTGNTIYDVDWNSNGSCALLVGSSGTLIKYDGVKFFDLSYLVKRNEPLFKVSWKPDGSYALISGFNQNLFKFDNNNLTTISNHHIIDIGWHPKEGYSILVGDSIWKYDCHEIIEIFSNDNFTKDFQFTSISWKPDGSFALVGTNSNIVYKYDGISFTNITEFDYKLVEIDDIDWHPDGTYALFAGIIWGGNYYTIWKYDLNNFQDITPNGLDFARIRSIEWDSQNNYALLIGGDYELDSITSGKCLKYDGVKFYDITESLDLEYFLLWRIRYNQKSGKLTIVGHNGVIYEYDGITSQRISKQIGMYNNFKQISWKPDGSYAIIIGNHPRYYDFNISNVYCYENNQLIDLSSEYKFFEPVNDVAWHPKQDYALIISGKNVWKYDENGFKDVSPNFEELENYAEGLRSISWKPDGEYAIIIGTEGYVLKFDGKEYEKNKINTVHDLNSVAWKPDSEYAIITANYGNNIWKFDGDKYKQIYFDDTNYTQGSIFLSEVSWIPDGRYALIVGRFESFHGTGTGGSFAIKYDGEVFIDLSNNLDQTWMWNSIDWKPDGSYAMLVGSGGQVVLYNQSEIRDISYLLYTWKDFNRIKWHPVLNYSLILGEDATIIRYSTDDIYTISNDIVDDNIDDDKNDDKKENSYFWNIILLIMIIGIIIVILYIYISRKKYSNTKPPEKD